VGVEIYTPDEAGSAYLDAVFERVDEVLADVRRAMALGAHELRVADGPKHFRDANEVVAAKLKERGWHARTTHYEVRVMENVHSCYAKIEWSRERLPERKDESMQVPETAPVANEHAPKPKQRWWWPWD
jgi:hypothetical protein